VAHRVVCPLLAQQKAQDKKHEAKMVADGSERTALDYFNLGRAAFGRGQVDKAIAAFREAIRMNPEYFEAHGNLGNALQAKGDLDGAIAAYRDAIRINPEYADSYGALGDALQANGDNAGAKSSFETFLRLGPDHQNAALIRTFIADLSWM
jgi:tetratricopeptide (TPR) repeat protein